MAGDKGCNLDHFAFFTGIDDYLLISRITPENYWLVILTLTEMIGLYYRDYPLNDPPPFLSGLSLVLRSS